MTVYDWQNTTFELQRAGLRLGILPVAATEQHGGHLPVGTDVVMANAIARGVAESLSDDVFLLPCMPLGTSALHGGTAGTVWVREETLYQVVYDIVESMYEHQIRYMVVINNHGAVMANTVRPLGNYIVKTAVRQLNYDYPENNSIWVQPFTVARQALMEIFESAEQDIQAGEVETSIMLHLAAEQVKGTGQDYLPGITKEYLDYIAFEKISASGVWGKPSLASAEKGAAALEAAVRETTRYAEDCFMKLNRMRTMRGTMPPDLP